MNTPVKQVSFWLPLLAALLLSGCGGGNEPAAPAETAPRATCAGTVRASASTGHDHVCLTYPVAEASAVPVTAQVYVKFSREMNAQTLDPASSVRLLDENDSPVAGTPTYDAARKDMIFRPDAALLHDSVYTMELRDTVLDADGVAIAAYSWKFTTAAAAGMSVALKVLPGPYSANLSWDVLGATDWEVVVSDQPTATPDNCGTGCVLWNSNPPQPLNTRFNTTGVTAALDLNRTMYVRLRGHFPGGVVVDSDPVTYKAPAPHFAYALNRENSGSDSTISAYVVDPIGGLLQPAGYVPISGVGDVIAMTGDQNLDRVFVTGTDPDGASMIWIFRPDHASGRPNESGSLFLGGDVIASPVTVSVDGRFAFALADDPNAVRSIRSYTVGIAEMNDTLEEVGREPAPSIAADFVAERLLVSPAGNWLHVAGHRTDGTGLLLTYRIGADGRLTWVSIDPPTPAAAGSFTALSASPTGHRVYAVERGASVDVIHTFSVAEDGTLAPKAQVQALGHLSAVLADGTGGLLYARRVGDVGTNDHIDVYDIAAEGDLTHFVAYGVGATATAPQAQTTFGIDPSGRFLYAVAGGDVDGAGLDATMSLFRIDAGALTWMRDIRTREAPVSFALAGPPTPVERRARFAYSANGSGNSVSQWGVDYASGGALGVVTSAGPLFTTTAQRVAVAAHPWRPALYVGNASPGAEPSLEGLAYSTTTGSLSPATSEGEIEDAADVVVESSGRFAYVGTTSGAIVVYDVSGGSVTNTLTSGDPGFGTAVRQLEVDPTGRFLYAIYEGSDQLGRCSINRDNGQIGGACELLTLVNGPAAAMAIHPDGQAIYFAHPANVTNPGVVQYPLDPLTGGLAGAPQMVPAGNFTVYDPAVLTLDPAGTHLYLANNGGTLLVFDLDPAADNYRPSDSPAELTGYPAAPRAMVFEPTGHYFYLLDAMDVHRYSVEIDPLSPAFAESHSTAASDSQDIVLTIDVPDDPNWIIPAP